MSPPIVQAVMAAALLALCALVATAAGQWNPVADPSSVIVFDRLRVTVLTEALVRVEISASKAAPFEFDDRPTFTVVNRRLPVPDFQVIESSTTLQIVTSALNLTYVSSGPPVNRSTCSDLVGASLPFGLYCRSHTLFLGPAAMPACASSTHSFRIYYQ